MREHLGSWVSALVDGQLDDGARERCLAHLAWCQECCDEVAVARRSRQILARELDDVSPAPDFMARLLALEVAGCRPEGAAPLAQVLDEERPQPPFVLRETLPPRWQALCGDLAPAGASRRWKRMSGIAAAAVTATAVGLFVLGERPVVSPDLRADAASGTLASALTTRGVDAVVQTSSGAGGTGSSRSDMLSWMQAEGWPCPQSLPEGFEVTAVRFPDVTTDILELDLSTPLGDVVIREQHGRLDTALVAGHEQLGTPDAPVYLLSDDPLHLVWQSSDTVVDLVARGSLDDVLQLVSTFSVDQFDTGLQARVGRGWTTLTGVLS